MTDFCSSQSLTATAWRMTPTTTCSERALMTSSLPSGDHIAQTPAPTRVAHGREHHPVVWLALSDPDWSRIMASIRALEIDGELILAQSIAISLIGCLPSTNRPQLIPDGLFPCRHEEETISSPQSGTPALLTAWSYELSPWSLHLLPFGSLAQDWFEKYCL